jgi:ParB/RepB/Spo0J family partition protein
MVISRKNGGGHHLYSGRTEIDIDDIDWKDTQFKFRMDFDKVEIQRLAKNIDKVGQLNPIKIRLKGDRYQILAGWKRAMAIKLLGDRPIIADVYEDIDDRGAYRINIADNVMRKDLTDIELAHQVKTLKEKDFSISEIAEMHGCKSTKIYDLLTLSKMSPEIKAAVHNGEIRLYAALELHKFPSSMQLEYLMKTEELKLSGRWLRNERIAITAHPLKEFVPTQVLRRMRGKVHAVKFIKTSDISHLFNTTWKLLGRHQGVPAPMKCETTLMIPSLERDPPFVCHNEIEYGVLEWGTMPTAEGYRELPYKDLDDRDVWVFACKRCIETLFPNCVFHEDLFYTIQSHTRVLRAEGFRDS